MKDAEVRGIVLERFYDARHKIDWLTFEALTTHVSIDPKILHNICGQLGEHGLIDWRPLTSTGVRTEALGRITAQGIDVVEGTAKAPITVVLHDHSISVSGSSNVQNGNRNQQSVTSQISSLIGEIDKIDAPEEQKKDAKGLLEKITANPLVVAVLGPLLGKIWGKTHPPSRLPCQQTPRATARRWRACCRGSLAARPQIVVVCSCRGGYDYMTDRDKLPAKTPSGHLVLPKEQPDSLVARGLEALK